MTMLLGFDPIICRMFNYTNENFICALILKEKVISSIILYFISPSSRHRWPLAKVNFLIISLFINTEIYLKYEFLIKRA